MRKTVGYAIIGTGGIAEKFAEDFVYVSGAKLLAVLSRDKDKAQAFAHKYHIPFSYGHIEELLKNPQVDVVYIATPHTLHVEQSLHCLKANKHVLCEKPMVLSIADAKQVFATAKKQQRFFMEALWTAFLPGMQTLLTEINSGKLGTLISIEADASFAKSFDPNSRLYNPELGGGALYDVGIYPVFLALTLFGTPTTIKTTQETAPTGVDASTKIELGFSNNRKALLTCSITKASHQKAILTGTQGTLHIKAPWWKMPAISVVTDAGESPVPFKHVGHGLHYQVQHVNQCLEKGMVESDVMGFERSLKILETIS